MYNSCSTTDCPRKVLKMSDGISASDMKKNDVARCSKWPQYIAGLSANLGSLAAGFIYGWTSPAGGNGENLVYAFEIDSNDFTWISSMYNVGAAVICIPIGMLANRIGRRRAMLMLTIPFIIGWACVIWPNSVITLIFGRFLLGMSGGAFCVAAPMYTTEIADTDTRGRLGSFYELFFITGILMAYTLGLLHNMFLQSLLSAIVPLIFFAVFFFMPETPTYYLMKGNVRAARETLLWLRGPDYDIDFELTQQQNAVVETERNKVSFFLAIRSPAVSKGLLICYGLMFFQIFSGIDIVTIYAGTIFREGTGDDVGWSPIVMGVMQVMAVFSFTLVADKWGRRTLLMISGAVMCLMTLVLGIFYYLAENGTSVDNFSWLPLACICSFSVSMSFGFDPIPWIMIGELFSPHVKAVAGSSACQLNWLMAFVVTKFYSQVKEQIGSDGTFLIFSAICGLSVIFVFFVVPETKSKTLEQIQIELSGYPVDDNLRKQKSDPNATQHTGKEC